MREAERTSLPCGVDCDLGDRRDGDVPDRGTVLLFRRRLGRGRLVSGSGCESPREWREAVAHVTYFVANDTNRFPKRLYQHRRHHGSPSEH